MLVFLPPFIEESCLEFQENAMHIMQPMGVDLQLKLCMQMSVKSSTYTVTHDNNLLEVTDEGSSAALLHSANNSDGTHHGSDGTTLPLQLER